MVCTEKEAISSSETLINFSRLKAILSSRRVFNNLINIFGLNPTKNQQHFLFINMTMCVRLAVSMENSFNR